MNHPLTAKSQLALDAIIAATLRPELSYDEFTQEEIRCYLAEPVELNSEDEEALASLDRKILQNIRQDTKRPPQLWLVAEAPEELYAAMNRQNDSDKLDDKAREELDRQRQRFIEEEKGKSDDKKADEDKTDAE